MPFAPIRTERLTLRPPRLDDVDAFHRRRDGPEVARYQNWELPYTRERGDASTARAVAMDGPTDGEGRSITVVDAEVPDHIVDDLVEPWYRAIGADGEIVGFVMATEVSDAHPNPYLWRFLVDRMHQRRGIGSAALDQFEQRCRDQGAAAVEVSWAEGPGSPAPLYLARGYEPSGRIDNGETHAVKAFA